MFSGHRIDPVTGHVEYFVPQWGVWASNIDIINAFSGDARIDWINQIIDYEKATHIPYVYDFIITHYDERTRTARIHFCGFHDAFDMDIHVSAYNDTLLGTCLGHCGVSQRILNKLENKNATRPPICICDHPEFHNQSGGHSILSGQSWKVAKDNYDDFSKADDTSKQDMRKLIIDASRCLGMPIADIEFFYLEGLLLESTQSFLKAGASLGRLTAVSKSIQIDVPGLRSACMDLNEFIEQDTCDYDVVWFDFCSTFKDTVCDAIETSFRLRTFAQRAIIAITLSYRRPSEIKDGWYHKTVLNIQNMAAEHGYDLRQHQPSPVRARFVFTLLFKCVYLRNRGDTSSEVRWITQPIF